MLKRQQFNDSESEKIAPRKRQWFDKRNNKEKQSLDENESEVKSDKYIFFPPLTLLLPP